MQCATDRAGFYYEKSSFAAAVLSLIRRQLKSLVVGYIILQIRGYTTAIVETCQLGLEFCVTKVAAVSITCIRIVLGAGPQEPQSRTGPA
jgi:hypothetical protein